MSTNRLRIQADQENQHKVGPVKNDLRIPLSEENLSGGNLPSKRPLSAKGNVNDKRLRVPFGGKDQNKVFPGLQRSKSSLPSTVQSGPLKQQQQQTNLRQGGFISAKPTLSKSNSSLGFFNRPGSSNLSALNAPKPRVTNPHKNNLLPPDISPQFASDSFEKAPSREIPALETRLSDTFSESTSRLHVSNQKFVEPLLGNIDPMKKGARNAEIESIIEALAEDEDSIDTIPERPQLEDDYVPLGVSPLTKEQAPFLYEEEPEIKIAKDYPPDHNFYSSEEENFDEDAIENRVLREELLASEPNHSFGLTEADMADLLDI